MINLNHYSTKSSYFKSFDALASHVVLLLDVMWAGVTWAAYIYFLMAQVRKYKKNLIKTSLKKDHREK